MDFRRVNTKVSLMFEFCYLIKNWDGLKLTKLLFKLLVSKEKDKQ